MNSDEIAEVIGLDVDAETMPDPDVWESLDKARARKGADLKPVGKVRNVVKILQGDPRWAQKVRLDAFAGHVLVKGRELTDEIETEVMLWLDRIYSLSMSTQRVAEAIRYVASINAFHPVRDWLRSLRWDGDTRADTMLTRLFGASDDGLNAELSRRFLISCVARAMEPGCKVDTSLILIGRQGLKKSTALRALCGAEWFSDTAIDMTSKDAYMSIQGVWIYELAELDSVRPREASTVKAFLASQQDRFRPAYGRNVVTQPRQVVFVGTTNEEEFLTDPTGARRFWPVKSESIDIPGITAERDQLWAEAVAAYDGGERWYLDGEAEGWLRYAQEQYRQVDPWEDRVREWGLQQFAAKDQGISVAQVLTGALDLPAGQQTKGVEMRTAGILTGLGWVKRRAPRRIDPCRGVRWFPSSSQAEIDE